MADNIDVTPGTGKTVATDDVGGVQYQVIKVAVGADGAATYVTSSDPFPVVQTGALPAGSNAIGKLAANSGVDIGDVDVTSAVITGGAVAHDGGGGSVNPILVGGYASAAAPTDVSADADSVRSWHLRNGAQATVLTAAGALIGGDATNGIDVDVTRIAGVAPAFGDGAKGATVLRTTLATDSAGIITTGTAGSASTQVLTVQGIASMTPLSATTTPAASEVHVGEVGGKSAVVAVTLSTDTSAYASGDLIADTQQIDAFFRKTDGTGVINSINIIDEDAQGVALYVIFMSTSTSLGTENSAPNISDANLTAGFQGIVAVATTDYVTISGTKVATIRNIGLPVKAVSGTDDIYIAVLNSTGTPTYTASGLEMRIGVLLD